MTKVMLLVLLVLLSLIAIEASDFFKDIEKCSYTEKGEEYLGTISVTKSGKNCKMWSEAMKINSALKSTHFSDKEFTMAKNFCRNPNSNKEGPWCFFGDKIDDWEVCSIPMCAEGQDCKDTVSGEEYDGVTNVTKTGRTCQSWSVQTPHTHRFKASSFPEKDINGIGNRCRNPDNEKSPWCYTTDPNIRWEYCNVPFCLERLSQAEYFKGEDDLGSVNKFVLENDMKQLYKNVTVFVAFPKKYVSEDVLRKTSVWATTYRSACQRNLNYYEYCRVDQKEKNDDMTILTFVCKNLLQSVIIITPLEKAYFTQKVVPGPIFLVNNELESDLLQYIKEVRTGFDTSKIKISIDKNGSPFHLLGENVIPYAVTNHEEVVMSFSKVGLGKIGLMGGEYFTKKDYQPILSDFYSQVYGSSNVMPQYISETYMQTLKKLGENSQNVKVSLIWNAHQIIGKENVKLLLGLIRKGANIIIGIKSWAYYHYVKKFEESELKELFLEAGVWPSSESVSGDLRVLDSAEIRLFPLVHLLDYAKANKSAAVSLAYSIQNTLNNIPFEKFNDEPLSASLIAKIKRKISELYGTYTYVIHSLVPCIDKPISDYDDRRFLDLFNAILLNSFDETFEVPGLNFYPGDIGPEVTTLETVRIKLNLPFKNENNFVGVFVPASKKVQINVNAKKSQTCKFHINFHLFEVKNWDRWDKWPKVRTEYVIASGKSEIITASFGGLLSIICDNDDDLVELRLTNVVRVAMYDRRNGPVDNSWHELKKRSVPWAILASDTLVFLVPLIAIRNLEDPEPVMEVWDKMIKEQFHLRGRSVAGTYREMVSTDFQIKAGYMHAGYPIGTFIQHVANPALRNKYLFAIEHLQKQASWGLNHEVGHNLQNNLFTFSGTVDVTNNVFTLVATEAMTGRSSWNETDGWVTEDNRLQNLIKHVNNRDFSFWQSSPFVGLGTYAQLRAEFGWEFYRQIFRRYDQLISEYGKRSGSLTNEERIQLWIVETSVLVKMNLVPLYDYWAWPITEQTKASLSKYPMFFPDDFMTKKTPEKTRDILAKYGDSTRKPLGIPTIIGPLKKDISIDGQKIINEISLL